jgi:hypothetical protein
MFNELFNQNLLVSLLLSTLLHHQHALSVLFFIVRGIEAREVRLGLIELKAHFVAWVVAGDEV